MKHALRTSLLAVALLAAAGTTMALTARAEPDDDEVVQLSSLPEAVRTTIREHARGGDIEKIERTTEDGQAVYEVEVEGRQGDFEFLVAQDGRFMGAGREDADDEAQGDSDEEQADGDDQEHTAVIQLDAAPKAVRDAFARHAHGAAPTRVEEITVEEVKKYELEFAANGGTASMTFADTGDLLEREMPVHADALPAAVRHEIQKDFPGATIKAAEAVELHYFEMEVEVNGKTIEVVALATGDIEDHVGPGGGRDDEDQAEDDDDENEDHARHRNHEEDDDDN